jgi:hypothetical protein
MLPAGHAAQGGSIVNIVADMWGSMPSMGHSGAARAGMVSFTETAAAEWAKSGVRVNAVAPGYIASSGMDHYPPEAGAMLREMRDTVPLGRFGTESETSAAVVFLLSKAANFISGSTLRIDGARPQVRMGWPSSGPMLRRLQREAVKPFDGFHLAETPKVFSHDASSRRGTRRAPLALQRREAMLRASRSCARWKSAAPQKPRPRRGPPSTSAASCCRANAWRCCWTPARPGCRCARWPATCRTRKDAGPVGAGRRRGGRHRLCQRRALHGGGQRLGHRSRRRPAMGLEKILRVQEIALQNKLPFLHLVESAGANLMRYRVEAFVQGGALFRNLARLSAAGIPVITVQHGSGTAGGAYMPGLSDVVIMVRGRSRAFLAGPPLLMAATGEVATEEELGGAEMHTGVSGLGEHLAEDDREALGVAREVVARLRAWAQANPPPKQARRP